MKEQKKSAKTLNREREREREILHVNEYLIPHLLFIELQVELQQKGVCVCVCVCVAFLQDYVATKNVEKIYI